MTQMTQVRLSDDIAALAGAAAARRGMTMDGFAAAAIERAAAMDAALSLLIEEGAADLAAGRIFSQQQVETMFDVRRDRLHAA